MQFQLFFYFSRQKVNITFLTLLCNAPMWYNFYMNKKKIITIIISVILVAGLVGGGISYKIRQQIPNNPPTTIGNTSGNLNNGGYFCENDGYVYFANFNDNHYLYKMDTKGTTAELVASVPVSYINAAGDYIYFVYDQKVATESKFMGFAGNMAGVYRIKNDGDNLHSILRDTTSVMSLIGNNLYFEHYDNNNGMSLYSATTDGKEKGQVMDMVINPACVIDGTIYFSNMDQDLFLYLYRPGSDKVVPVLEYSMYDPVYSDGYLYFLNMKDDYCLYRYGISSGAFEKITSQSVDVFNVYQGVIFYQTLKDPGLYRVNADGTNQILISEGTFSNINCTSTYTYFTPFKNEKVYVTPTFGNGEMGTFNP